jgi:tRNA pseudouridine32 synthase/23S rRNA pseudouridine746 synthase
MKKRVGKIAIVFENEFVVIADKPSGTLSVPSRLGEHEKRPILKDILEKQLKYRLWAAHRLDFEVSGLILYAKDADSHRLANTWFEKQQIQKTYHATTEGDSAQAATLPQTIEWRSYLVRGKKRAFEAPYGQPSVTNAKFIGADQYGLHWELYPRTGRGHQLRYELAKHGFPIAGDLLYGAKVALKEENVIQLKAVAMDFLNCTDFKKLKLPEKIELPSR